jgi:D-alanyl-D-alanine carboxypeptidase
MFMKNFCVLLLTLSNLTSCTNTEPDYNAKKIDQLVSELAVIKRTAGVAYGIQIGNVISDNKEFGFDDLEKKTPIRKNAQFRIASMTKPITATAIMQLIEKGKLSLDDTIDKFFPNLANASKITIYQLLSHTSGIPNWFEAEMPKDEPKDFPMCKNPHIYLERMGIKSLFEPGTFHAYSNTGYVLLGEIIEIVSRQSYFEYLKSNILAPANMVDTEMEYVEQPSPNWVKGYAFNPELSNPFTKPEFYHMPFSAGGLRSSISDVMKFMTALQAGKLISKGSYEKMTSYALVKNGQPVYDNLFSPSGQKPNFPSNIKKWGYGLGFQIIENFGTKVISHGGDIAGFNSVLMYIPKNNTTIVILSNTENGILSKLRDIEKAATDIELKR